MDFICPHECSYRTSSGYCGSTGGWESCQYRQLHQPNTVVGYVPPLKKTNADRIRAMTDKELAKWLDDVCKSAYDEGYTKETGDPLMSPYPSTASKWMDWLKEEASDEKDKLI